MRIKHSTEELRQIVKNASSWADVCRAIGSKPATGSQTYIKNKVVNAGIDCSHFTGRAWNKGKVMPVKDITKFLVSHGPKINSHKLKLKLIKCGMKKDECEMCGLSEWLGEKIVLELDHKNSDHFDNQIDNLQIICSNCHALETRRRRDSRKKRP